MGAAGLMRKCENGALLRVGKALCIANCCRNAFYVRIDGFDDVIRVSTRPPLIVKEGEIGDGLGQTDLYGFFAMNGGRSYVYPDQPRIAGISWERNTERFDFTSNPYLQPEISCWIEAWSIADDPHSINLRVNYDFRSLWGWRKEDPSTATESVSPIKTCRITYSGALFGELELKDVSMVINGVVIHDVTGGVGIPGEDMALASFVDMGAFVVPANCRQEDL